MFPAFLTARKMVHRFPFHISLLGMAARVVLPGSQVVSGETVGGLAGNGQGGQLVPLCPDPGAGALVPDPRRPRCQLAGDETPRKPPTDGRDVDSWRWLIGDGGRIAEAGVARAGESGIDYSGLVLENISCRLVRSVEM